MTDPVCNRCGRCCHYQKTGQWVKCKNLEYHGKKSSCRIWKSPDRVGSIIDDELQIRCTTMEKLPITYVGCPYNIGKPIVLVNLKRYDR